MGKKILSQEQINSITSILSNGKFQEGLEKTTILLQRYPTESLLFNLSGACYQGLGQLNTAVEYYEKSISTDPSYFKAHFNLGGVLQELGKLNESIESFENAISIKPDFAEAYNNIGNVFKEIRQSDNAIRSFKQAIEIKPDYVEAHFNLGQIFQELNEIKSAILSYENVLIFKPDFAQLHNNLGVIFQGIGEIDSSLKHFEDAIRIKPDFEEAHYNLGNAFYDYGQHNNALESYRQALIINPENAQTHNNIGITLKALDKIDSALKSYKQAILIKPNHFEAHYNLGNILKDLGQLDEAVKSYQKSLILKQDNAEAHNELGITLMYLGKLDAAIKSYEEAICINPVHEEFYNNLGIAFNMNGQFEEALKSLNQALSIKQDYAEAFLNLGNLMLDFNQLDKAVMNYTYAYDLKPKLNFLFGDLLHTKMHLGIWDNLSNELNRLTKKINNNEKVITQFPLLALIDDPKIQRKNAEIYVNDKYPRNNDLPKIGQYLNHKKIRIGYFSADFREHPVSTLTAELYEIHNRNQFEIYAFSYGPDTNDKMNLRIKAGVDHFHDVRTFSHKEVAMLSRSLEIDIAIDLGGHTKGARTGIFAISAAPIQVSYIGVLSTMGADYYDYLIADLNMIPKKYQKYYSEKIVYLPSFQINDSKKFIPTTIFTRKDLGLPLDGFVFCCLNNTFKITPTIFDCWGRILKKVKDSVLLIYADNESTQVNLRSEIAQRGINPNRLIFGKHLPKDEYLARYLTADLFLDTHPFNAGTTASDSLRMGLPVLTLEGKSFNSREASSILSALNLPELITATREEYESVAVKLATHPEKLKIIKTKLLNNLTSAPLYNSTMFTRHLESAYSIMYDRFQQGCELDHIYVKN